MPNQDIDTVRSFIHAINTQNIGVLGALMSEDHTFIDGNGGVTTGREILLASWPKYFDMFPDYVIEVESIISEDSLVAVFGKTSGTYKGKDGLKPENKVGGPAAWRAEVREGKVKTWQVYADYTKAWKIIEANQ